MGTDWNLVELTDLGVLRFRGVEAVKFLQGQLSNDVEKLSPEQSQLAGYHNPQGRVIALLRLLQLAPDDVLALLPRELASSVAARLTKFVLRTKVKIADESAEWKVAGLVAPFAGVGPAPLSVETVAQIESHASNWAAAQFVRASVAASAVGERSSAAAQLEEADSVVELPAASALLLPDAINSVSHSKTSAIIRVAATPARWLAVSPASDAIPLTGCAAGTLEAWRLLDVADGAAQVYAVTSEEFVAQMLNLDVLGGISFEKGCYTGQEVIARAHYRGRVKRRMQRFRSRGPVALAVGESGHLADGRTFKVVEAAVLADGRCEFLAVAPTVAGEAGETPATHSVLVIDAEVLPMSYPLPE